MMSDDNGFQEGPRNKYYTGIVEAYLKHHEIESIISGHQDNITFGMMHPSYGKEEFTVSDNLKFKIDENDKLLSLGYLELYDQDRFNFNISPSNKYFDKLKEKIVPKTYFGILKQDFLACVTSSCVLTKFLYYRSVLTLECTQEYLKELEDLDSFYKQLDERRKKENRIEIYLIN